MFDVKQKAQLLPTQLALRVDESTMYNSCAMLRIVENVAITQSHSRSFELTLFNRACVSCY